MLVHNKGDYVRNYKGVRLVPGVNKVTEEQWERFASHPLNQVLIKKGELVPQIAAGADPSDELTGTPKTLAEVNAGEAVALIKDTHDLKLLAELLQEEEAGKKRSTVIDAISKQAETIEKEIEEAKEKAKNGGSENE